MTQDLLLDKIRGSLVGGAVGDALGYPVEFAGSFYEIRANYGEAGVTEYDTAYPRLADRHREAQFSDDTQMTLYTAEGLLEAVRSGKPIVPTICEAYLAWYGHQVGRTVRIGYKSALAAITELNQRRAPGNTCLTALAAINSGRRPANTSKGCGGIMRVAPVALYGAAHAWSLADTGRLAGEAAELTHLHPLSTYSSAALAIIVQLCASTHDAIDRDRFISIAKQSLDVVAALYGPQAPYMDFFRQTILKAISLADDSHPDWQLIERSLGGGWVAEETLAIAIFSVIRHISDFNACMICAVNHGGDSDSTGAVAGNILGEILGYSAIPEKFLGNLQLRQLLLDTADALRK